MPSWSVAERVLRPDGEGVRTGHDTPPAATGLAGSRSATPTEDRPRTLAVVDLGIMAYDEALDVQRSAAAARIDGRLPVDVLLLVEHPPVITIGRSGRASHLLASPEVLRSRGVERREVERGGDVTFHGPGQLVGYPIMDLKEHRRDLHWYLRQIEAALIAGLQGSGLPCCRQAGLTGVWTAGVTEARLEPDPGSSGAPEAVAAPWGAPGAGLRKIASIGVHARDWVTWHGFAVNLTTDLSWFDLIVPCGIDGVRMTSVRRELGDRFSGAGEVTDRIVGAFAGTFGMALERQPRSWLDGISAVGAASPNDPERAG